MTTPRERAARAIASVHEEQRYWEAYISDAEAALAALAEPSEAMIEAIKSAWKTPHVSISDSGAVKIWKAAHAAMMAENP